MFSRWIKFSRSNSFESIVDIADKGIGGQVGVKFLTIAVKNCDLCTVEAFSNSSSSGTLACCS